MIVQAQKYIVYLGGIIKLDYVSSLVKYLSAAMFILYCEIRSTFILSCSHGCVEENIHLDS